MDTEGAWEGAKTSAVRYKQILMFHRIGVVRQLPYPEGMGLTARSPGFIGFRASVPV